LYEKHVYNQHAADAMRGDAGALDETRHATRVARDYGTGLAVTGIAAVGIASYLYFTGPHPQPVVAPAVSPGQVGAIVTGRF